ncbi:hypothetical protein [Paenibacillus sp. PAMC21692]|uniref:hypothetical protein n=1 Tax=Paenibacillus sp. PAMC21692 TaxID=2762320 RepID=UPI00164DB6B6|nr:hypothetical protein [Paenibacillus sp. PAMC21692]QNK56287.1 hypothetical protein H7F31_27655 [Paenibacillus sp. PAMC21692]
MKKRPLPVTIISILIMLVGVFAIISYTLALSKGAQINEGLNLKVPGIINITIKYIGAVLLIIGSTLILRGNNWGRSLVIGWCVLSLILFGDYVGPRIIYIIIMYLMLFNKRANAFFYSNPDLKNKEM